MRQKVISSCKALSTLKGENLEVGKLDKYQDNPGRLPRGRKPEIVLKKVTD